MKQSEQPLVGIIMGSDSDWPQMKGAAEALDEFGIGWEATVMSAHRAPEVVADYGKAAAGRGLRAIIAGAGGAAHLGGVVAAVTTLPVITVPIETKLAGGLDSLLSMVQMPPGVPVACVGVGAGRNAGILAAQIIASGDATRQQQMSEFKKKQLEQSQSKNQKLQQQLKG